MLLKVWTIVGFPRVAIAVRTVAAAEIRAGEQCGESMDKITGLNILKFVRDWESMTQRGEEYLCSLYQPNLEAVFFSWGRHTDDFSFIDVVNIVYGMFLSNTSVLDAVTTSVIILSGIICQRLRGPTIWHLRDLRRLELEVEEMDRVQEAILIVSEWCGADVVDESWPTARDASDLDLHDSQL